MTGGQLEYKYKEGQKLFKDAKKLYANDHRSKQSPGRAQGCTLQREFVPPDRRRR